MQFMVSSYHRAHQQTLRLKARILFKFLSYQFDKKKNHVTLFVDQ